MRALSLLSAAVLLVASGVTPGHVRAQTSPQTIPTIPGVAALQGTPPVTKGFLKATPVPGKPLQQKLDLWMTPVDSAVPVKEFQVEMTKKLHVVIVSEDFKTFMHIHPDLSKTGHFTITQDFPAPGTYLVYADGLPDKINDHQVFRFELPIGKPAASTARTLPTTGMGVHVGPYEVDLSSLHLHAGRMDMVDIEILENGKPAKDLHPYLGAPAHAVFLNSKDLTYVHVHPMAMDASMDMSKPVPPMPDNASSPGEMMLMVNIKEAGTYKLWLQFKGPQDQKPYVAEFTMSAN
jgi:hypothetical protein